MSFLQAAANTKFVLIGLLIILVLVICAAFFVWQYISICKIPVAETTKSQVLSPGKMGAGLIGEIKVKDEETGEEVPLVTPEIPVQVYNTTGEIIEVKADQLIVRGSGNNFADQSSRTLTVMITDATLIYNENFTISVKGTAGLKYLKAGDSVLIEGNGNIRGRTLFEALQIIKQ